MSFLFKGLRDKHKYWEAVNLFRKAMHALSATVLAPLGPDVQILFMFMVLVAYIGLQSLARPYEKIIRLNEAGLPLPHIGADHRVVLEETDKAQAVDEGQTVTKTDTPAEDRSAKPGNQRRPSFGGALSAGGRRGSVAPGRRSSIGGRPASASASASSSSSSQTEAQAKTKLSEMSDEIYDRWSEYLWIELVDTVRQ